MADKNDKKVALFPQNKTCPLYTVATLAADKTVREEVIKCNEDRCAWWVVYFDGTGYCAITEKALNS